MGQQMVIDWRLLGSVLFGLLMYGVVYNELVQRLGKRKEGYTSLLVVAGVLVTLAGVSLISWQSALLTLCAFAASGLPMVIGDIRRYVEAREKALETMRQEAAEAQERHESP